MGPEGSMSKNDRAAYEMAARGLTFKQIGERQQVATTSAHRRARRHAQREGRPWPPRVRIGEASYQLRQAGLSYADIAERLGISEDAARSAEHKHRTSRGLPPAEIPTIGQRAYWLRATDTGLTWEDIAREVGSLAQDCTGALNSAKHYAQRNGRPWPPRRTA